LLRARIDEQIAVARKRLESADTLILESNPLIEPKEKVKEVVDHVLTAVVAERIQIRFSTIAEYREWAYNCVNRALHKKWKCGKVDRLQTTGRRLAGR
jgi:hypothetical protein